MSRFNAVTSRRPRGRAGGAVSGAGVRLVPECGMCPEGCECAEGRVRSGINVMSYRFVKT